MSSRPSSQARISSFFQTAPSMSGQKRRDSSPIDLTSDNELSEPPAKKLRTSFTPRAIPSSATAVEQYRFTEIPNDTPLKPRTEREIRLQKERHEAFKKKLLMDNNRFLSSRPDPTPSEMRPVVDMDEAATSEEEDSDQEFRRLNDMFAHKGPRKGKAKSTAPKAVAKKKAEIGPSGQPYTPLEMQVLQLKKENPGVVLMIEVGYKFKFFGDDAKIAAKELGMVSFNDRNFLVASIPNHRRDVHMKKLLHQGYKVGIVAQVETAALKKISDNRNAPFERKLIRLHTAATYVEDLDSVDDLEKYSPPPFMCIVEERKGNDVSIGMVTICPSTGDVVWDDFEDAPLRIELESRLVHMRPKELLFPRKGLSEATAKMLSQFSSASTSRDRIRAEQFEETMTYSEAFSFVSEFYTQKNLLPSASKGFVSGELMAEITDFPKRVVVALAHAVKYLSAFSLADAFVETKFFTKFTTRAHMLLAANTMINLEIYENETTHSPRGSLIWILDKTKTKFGARLLKSWVGRPLVDKRMLTERVDAVEEILQSSSERLVALRQVLKGLPDLARGLCRIQYGQCTPQELSALFRAFNKIATAFDTMESPADAGFKSSILNDIIFSMTKLRDPVKEMISIVNLNKAAEGSKDTMWNDPDRYEGIADSKLGLQAVEAELENELKRIRKLLKMPSLQWTSVAGDDYLIEVKRSENRPIPVSWPNHSKTRYFERFQPPEVRQLVEELAQHQENLQAEAHRAFQSFLEEITRNNYVALRNAVNSLAVADCLLSFALVALQDNYVRPEFVDDDVLEIVEGRHPMVEVLRADPFVPNSIKMGGGDNARSKIITGPNMGGKSSCVRMIALITLMAQIGSYVPALSVKLGLVDSILMRMGASDDIAKGRSTFMVEMSETSDILRAATEKSLVILDELGRGTSTFDGMAIADAVLQHLVETIKSKTLFITHYPLVASQLEKKFPLAVENVHMKYEAETRIDGSRSITFLYRLANGMATESFGIECGRSAGLPETILSSASQHASTMEEEVQRRIKRNTMRKVAHLIKVCLENNSIIAIATVPEIRAIIEPLHTCLHKE